MTLIDVKDNYHEEGQTDCYYKALLTMSTIRNSMSVKLPSYMPKLRQKETKRKEKEKILEEKDFSVAEVKIQGRFCVYLFCNSNFKIKS